MSESPPVRPSFYGTNIRCVFENTKERGIRVGNSAAANEQPVRGCEDTMCEMCLNYLAYYPRITHEPLACSGAAEFLCDDSVAGKECTAA